VSTITSVTREEHTGGIPSIESSIEAIKTSKIAAHIIDMNKLGNYLEDEEIVNYRSKRQTCVFGKKKPGCSRCADVCPLKYSI
jgi:phosphomethylpyrimidine synthase